MGNKIVIVEVLIKSDKAALDVFSVWKVYHIGFGDLA